MTRKEAVRINAQESTLIDMGFTALEAEQLRRISMTLSRWSEHECNGTIERDENRGNTPYWSNPNTGRHFVARVPDREAGALARLKRIMAAHPTLTRYVQGDPRGCALYILRPRDVPNGADVRSYYQRGIAVY